jgi:hypothetical protein
VVRLLDPWKSGPRDGKARPIKKIRLQEMENIMSNSLKGISVAAGLTFSAAPFVLAAPTVPAAAPAGAGPDLSGFEAAPGVSGRDLGWGR